MLNNLFKVRWKWKNADIICYKWRHCFLCNKEMLNYPKNWSKLMKIANTDRESLHIFWTTWGISIEFSEKMWPYQPLFRRCIFGKVTCGVKLKSPFRVKVLIEGEKRFLNFKSKHCFLIFLEKCNQFRCTYFVPQQKTSTFRQQKCDLFYLKFSAKFNELNFKFWKRQEVAEKWLKLKYSRKSHIPGIREVRV